MLRRLPDWQIRLADHIQNVSVQPFEWGKSDCLTWCAGAVEAMTGCRAWPSFEGKYGSRREMIEMLRAMGHPDILSAATSIMTAIGLEPVGASGISVGDPAVIDSGDGGQSLAIRVDGGFGVRHLGGLGLASVEALAAWRLE